MRNKANGVSVNIDDADIEAEAQMDLLVSNLNRNAGLNVCRVKPGRVHPQYDNVYYVCVLLEVSRSDT